MRKLLFILFISLCFAGSAFAGPNYLGAEDFDNIQEVLADTEQFIYRDT